MKNCDLLTENGRCRKYEMMSCERCESKKEWFTDPLEVCNVDEVCRNESIFGNGYFRITKKQLDDLQNGKVLYDLSEYGTFIMLEQ